MDAVQKARLQTLGEHLESGKLGHEVFDIGDFNNVFAPECGTAGCGLGECPIAFPEHWAFGVTGSPSLKSSIGEDGDGEDPFESAEKFFGLTYEEVRHLFMPYHSAPNEFGGAILNDKATRYDVAAQISALLKVKEVVEY